MSINEKNYWKDIIKREIDRAVREVYKSREKSDAVTDETPKPPSDSPEHRELRRKPNEHSTPLKKT